MEIVSRFLSDLSSTGESGGFQLLRNFGQPPRSKLPTYHALIEFVDAQALEVAMKHQAQRGIHAGGHGQVVDAVCDFHVEIFTSVADSQRADSLHACEI